MTMDAFDTQHEDMIHDAQFDYYGKRLATCSSDRIIKIFQLVGQDRPPVLLSELKGHEGPVWQLAWAHPKFGNILASCGYDKKVMVWKEQSANTWACIYTYTGHSSSVNSLAFAPHEFGLLLACGSSDGYVSVLSHRGDQSWDERRIEAHGLGCNAVSWAPAAVPGTMLASGGQLPAPARRLVTGGCDKAVKFWRYAEAESRWEEEKAFEHEDWVRDVAWAPNVGLPTSTVASCSQDKTVAIYTETEGGNWEKTKTLNFETALWRVSWSVTGNVLAVSAADNTVTLWKEAMDGEWKKVDTLKDEAAAAPQ